jgi:transposase-like protein
MPNWKFKNIMRKLRPICNECKKGHINYIGEDWTGRVWLSIYECDNCGKQFI